MKKTELILALITLSIVGQSWAGPPELPPFLPKHYASAFQTDGKNLNLLRHSTTNNVEQWVYSTGDRSMGLSVELIKCDRPRGKAIFNNMLRYLNKQIGDHRGQFREITETEVHAEILEQDVERSVFAYILPNSIQIWTFSVKQGSVYALQDKFTIIRSMTNRQRYTEALAEGNVSMGSWGPQIHEYASALLKSGKRKEALSVLKNLLATSPYNYEAHLDFVTNTKDLAAATNSAKIVMENAENSKLLSQAAKFLGRNLSGFESVPILSTNETGPQVILIPLLPCSPWFLDDVAETYQKMTEIPVKIRRLKEKWNWSVPDRIPHQRTARGLLVRMKGENIDFTNWTKEKYVEALRSSVATENALSKYYVKDLIARIEKGTGQYFVDPYLDRLCKILKAYRSNDNRTMYVGITEANIYSGDNNYLFSLGRVRGKSLASILSYHMMLASTFQDEYESRQRLTERIAKELVPASLKQLRIPRSTDPRCPYSYSSSVSRLDEKTLRLSGPLKNALKKLKIQQNKDSDDPE